MAQVEIPANWLNSVSDILATEQSGTLVEWTIDAKTRYEADSNFSWEFEVYAALRVFLALPRPSGCRVIMGKPAGETYEFYFPFKGRRFYGKILMRGDLKRVVIFSAHRPLKIKLSCE